MYKVIFDTVVFIRSLINPRSFWGSLVFEYSSDYRLFVSQDILFEIFEVLKRPEIKSKFKTLQGLDVRKMLEIIKEAETAEVSVVPKVSRDLKDDKFLAAAEAINAHYLISEDKDLLDLKEYKGVKIITAESFLKILKHK